MMSRRQSTLFWFSFIAIVAAALSALMFIVINARSKVREVHTEFLFRQIRTVVETSGIPSDHASFVDALRRADIDWNSCTIDAGGLRDGWGRPIKLLVSQAHVHARSSGRDGVALNDDDIEMTIQITAPSPQPASPMRK